MTTFFDAVRTSWLLCLLLLIACGSQPDTPDVSHIDVRPTVIRFDQLLMDADTLQAAVELPGLIDQHREFAEVFFYQIVSGRPQEQSAVPSAQRFVSDQYIRALHDSAHVRLPDFQPYAQELEEALQYFKFYFPAFPIPTIYTCISGFEVGAFTIGDDILGVGLDFFLGQDYSQYPTGLFPDYIRRTMTPDYLVAKSMQALIANYVGETRGNRLLDYMLRNGRALYIKRQLLPHAPDEIVHEFTAAQLEWLEDNESAIWAHLLGEELLYSTNYRQFQKLITPSPNAPNMPPEAPGRVANWMGYRIVQAFMERHPQVTLTALLEMDDGQKILAESKYKPRQKI